MIEVSIASFEPFSMTLPTEQVIVGEVKIILPAVHLKVYDLSMGGLLPGAHIGADDRIASVSITLPGPGVSLGEFVEFINRGRDDLREIWRIMQGELDKHGPLLK
jgi:hypothetical protein